MAITTTNAQMSMADWLLSGVLARFPRLKIAFSESQIGWMPFMFERVDNIFTKGSGTAMLDPVITKPTWTAIVFEHQGMGEAMQGLFDNYWKQAG